MKDSGHPAFGGAEFSHSHLPMQGDIQCILEFPQATSPIWDLRPMKVPIADTKRDNGAAAALVPLETQYLCQVLRLCWISNASTRVTGS